MIVRLHDLSLHFLTLSQSYTLTILQSYNLTILQSHNFHAPIPQGNSIYFIGWLIDGPV